MVLATHRQTTAGFLCMTYQIRSVRSCLTLSKPRRVLSHVEWNGEHFIPDLTFDGHWLFGSNEYGDPREWRRSLMPDSLNASLLDLAEIAAGGRPNPHGQVEPTPLAELVEGFNALKLSGMSLKNAE